MPPRAAPVTSASPPNDGPAELAIDPAKPLRIVLPGTKLPDLDMTSELSAVAQRKSNGNSGNASPLRLPGFREAVPPKRMKKWTRPAKLIADEPDHGTSTLYDADSEDEAFIASLQASRSNAPSLENLERAITVLEVEDFRVQAALKESRADADLRNRNARTVASANFLLHELKHNPQGAPGLIASAVKAGEAVLTAAAPHSPPTASNGTASSTSVSPVRVHQVLGRTKREAHDIFTYWTEKRKRVGSALLVVRTVEDPGTHVTADELKRIQALREDLERARLIADSTRKREKLKSRLAALECT